MSLSATIKSIQDIMRKDVGVDGDAQRVSQLCWMLFLKIFDDRETEYELIEDGYRSPIPNKYRWRTWAADAEGLTGDVLLDFVNNELFPKLKSLPSGGNGRAQVVRSVFEDAYNYMKSGTLLRQVINKINETIDFNDSKSRHTFGDIYEQLLKDLQSAGNAGEYYTPRAVTQFIVDMVDPQLKESVLDPACGTGGFLTCTIEHKRKQVKKPRDEQVLQASIQGVEKKPMPHLLCITNMLLHGIDVPSNIRHDNTLARPLRDYGKSERVDIVVTNPPFGGMEEDGIEHNFPSDFRTKETADLFLVFIMHILKKNGRAALVLPDGTLFGQGVKDRIKEKLLSECSLHTVVRLPNGVFSPYTGIKTNLLFFTKGEPTTKIWFYEHPYPPGQKSYNKTRPINIQEFDAEKAWWNDRKESEDAWCVDFASKKKEALAKAQPHWDSAEQARKQVRQLGDKLRDAKSDLTVLERKLRDAGPKSKEKPAIKALIAKQQAETERLSVEVEQFDSVANNEQRAGDGIYWPIFNLNIKNPNIADEGPGDPDKLLQTLDRLTQEAVELRNTLKSELARALLGGAS